MFIDSDPEVIAARQREAAAVAQLAATQHKLAALERECAAAAARHQQLAAELAAMQASQRK